MSCTTAQQGADCIRERLVQMQQQQLIFTNLNQFTLDTDPGKGETDAGISKLDAPAAYRQKLLAVYQDPEGQLSPLVQLMEPVMNHLSRELRPWAACASMMLKAWEEKMQQTQPESFLKDYLHIEGPATAHGGATASTIRLYVLWPDICLQCVRKNLQEISKHVVTRCRTTVGQGHAPAGQLRQCRYCFSKI